MVDIKSLHSRFCRQFGSPNVFSPPLDGGTLFRKYFFSCQLFHLIRLWRVNDFAYKIVRNKRKNFTMESAGGDLLSLYLERQEESMGQSLMTSFIMRV